MPSEAEASVIRWPFFSTRVASTFPVGSVGNSKSTASIGVSSVIQESRWRFPWPSRQIAWSTDERLRPLSLRTT